MLPGDRVLMTGSLDCMGRWEQSIELTQSTINRNIWTVELEMPLNMSDTSLLGIFHYKYEIESARDGRISEGQFERSETKMRKHFFHFFRPNYSHSRFRMLQPVSPVHTFEQFLSEILIKLKRNDFSLRKFMRMYMDLMECLPHVQRAVLEHYFNTFLEEELIETVTSSSLQ